MAALAHEDTPRLTAGDLRLEPLDVSHADEMVEVLDSQELYEFTGGSPPSLKELRRRYERQVAGPDPQHQPRR